jgi:crotonobetainyl-CoA:carnitine CoA-transferase CaiB-like acyl-CoA transferase
MTAPADANPGPLAGIRVLEIGERGEVAGRLLADAGADVLRIEPPGGSAGRRQGPFTGDRPGIEASLHHVYFNANKRGITLDPTTEDGRSLWRRLVVNADVVIDSAGPGVLDMYDAGPESNADLADEGRLVWCSITPFGLTGPWRDWEATDLVSVALGGPMMSSGYDDHELPPIRPDGEHSLWMGGEYAAAGILAALFDREHSGRGQLIDVSIHESVSATTEGSFPNWEYARRLVQRQTGRHSSPVRTPNWQYDSPDGGHILLMTGGLPRTRGSWAHLLAWMQKHGMAEDLDDEKYARVIYTDPMVANPDRERMTSLIGRFVQSLPREEAYRGAQAIRLPWGPVRRPEENLDDPHWEDREFWARVEVPGHTEPVRIPLAPYHFTATPMSMRRRAPLLGEHNFEVYGSELGLSTQQLVALAETGTI